MSNFPNLVVFESEGKSGHTYSRFHKSVEDFGFYPESMLNQSDENLLVGCVMSMMLQLWQGRAKMMYIQRTSVSYKQI